MLGSRGGGFVIDTATILLVILAFGRLGDLDVAR